MLKSMAFVSIHGDPDINCLATNSRVNSQQGSDWILHKLLEHGECDSESSAHSIKYYHFYMDGILS